MTQGFMQTGGMIPVGGDDGQLTYNTIDDLEDPTDDELVSVEIETVESIMSSLLDSDDGHFDLWSI